MTLAPDLPSPEIINEAASIWGTELRPAGCPQCKQTFLRSSEALPEWCPVCGKSRLEAQPALLRREAPEVVLPARITAENLIALYANFCKGVWLATEDFSPQRLAQRAVLVYWPMWLVDCNLAGGWQAEIGYDYQVQSTQESYHQDQWQSHSVVETRVRWEPRAGQIDRFYQNTASPAVSDHERLVKRLGSYPVQEARAYDPALLSQALLRLPDLPPENAWPYARARVEKLASADVAAAADGQHFRECKIDAQYTRLNWTQLLLPTFVSYYTADDGQVQLVEINAVTGSISGRRLASQKKGWRWAGILACIALLTFLVSIGLITAGAALPPLGVVGTLGVILAIGLGLFAIVPAVWPWQWNRGQVDDR